LSCLYIYDEFARSFQRTRSILSIWTTVAPLRPRRTLSLAMIEAMSEKRQPGVIGSLPSTRPHRRSGKRASPNGPVTGAADAAVPASTQPAAEPAPADEPAAAKPDRAKPAAARTQAADRSRTRTRAAARTQRATEASGDGQHPGRPLSPARDSAPPAPAPASPGALQTAVEAVAELTEIGLRASARALRVALSRLPKP
jgi:hypothetical protein